MSQIRMDQPLNQNLTTDPSLDHYTNNALEPKVHVDNVPQELQNAKPVSHSSGWMTAGRIALAIVSVGMSELFRLVYLGIKSCCSSSRPTEPPAPRVQANAKGLPNADPDISKQNATLANAIEGKCSWPQQYKEGIDALMNDLRSKYGVDLIPKHITLKELSTSLAKVNSQLSRNFYLGIKESKRTLSPNELSQHIKQMLLPSLNRMVLTSIAEEHAQKNGGMGGINMPNLVNNLLSDPALQKKLQSVTNKEDALRFADDMQLRQKITQYQEAIHNSLNELRAKYGADRVPKNMTEALSVNSEGQTILSKVDNKFSQIKEPVSAKSLQKSILSYFAQPLLQLTLEKALTEKAKEMGVPLNRRAIVLLANNQLKQPEIFNALNTTDSPKSLSNALNSIGLDKLLQTQKETVERLYATHAPTMPEELKPLLRTFIEGFSYAPSDAAASEQKVVDMVNRMKEWKNLDGSEDVRQPLNNVFKQDFATDLSRLEGSGESTGYTDNIYDQMPLDAHRSDFVINGQVIDKDNAAQDLTAAVKNALPDPKDQQFISKLINQRMWSQLVIANTTSYLPNGETLNDFPGGKLLPSTPPGSNPLVEDAKIHSRFTVTVSPDKKTAMVTGTLIDNINYGGETIDGRPPHFGGVKFTMNFTLNLNGHENGQGVADFTLAQEFIPKEQIHA